jgi:succinyl-diaminopimelate desuccinylase
MFVKNYTKIIFKFMEDHLKNFAKKLISIPSVKGNQSALKKVLDVATENLSNFPHKDFISKETVSTLYMNQKNKDFSFKVILNGHLDIVPAKDEQFAPFEKDGKLYGRGAIDMKSAAAVMIEVFKEVANKVSYPLGLQLVTDEEIGGYNGTKFQIGQGVRADFVIAGEHTNYGVNSEAKGIMWVKINVKGKAAHGAYPWNGVNAITLMQKIIEKINNEFPVPKKESWKTTINIAKIETSNEAFNKVPDDCTLLLDIRYVAEDKERIKKFIKKISKEHSYEFLSEEPAQFTDKKNSFVEQLRKSVKKVTSKESLIIKKHGGSDIRHFNGVGCDGVTFGPLGEGLHTDNEWVDIKSLEDYYKILKDFLLSLEK